MTAREPQDAARPTPGPYAAEHGNNFSFVIGGDGLTMAAACGPVRSAETCRANADNIALALSNYAPLRKALRGLLQDPFDILARKRAWDALVASEAGERP